MTDEKLQRQLELEQAALDGSYARLRSVIDKTIKRNAADELLEGRLILLTNIDLVSAKISEYFAADLRGKKAAIRKLIAADFSEKPRDLAFILITEIVRRMSITGIVSATELARAINRSVYDTIKVRRLDASDNTFSAFVDKRFKHRSLEFRTKEKLKIVASQNELALPELTSDTVYLGATLIGLVEASGANIIETKWVYTTKVKKAKHVTFTPECYAMVLQSREILLNEYRKFPIHLIQPKPWKGFKGSGGYQREDIYENELIKAHGASKKLLSGYLDKVDNQCITDTLNILQGTSWRVNSRVFAVMDKIFDNSIEDPTMPRTNPKLIGGLPVKYDLEATDLLNEYNYGSDVVKGENGKAFIVDKEAYARYYKDLQDVKDNLQSNKGKAILLALALSEAREYLYETEMFFSYQYDFRGRIYPIQQHLQPQGTSWVKALLEFSNGYPIDDEESYKWFMVNGANYYGYDKIPYAERVAKMEAMKDDVIAVAENPMGNHTIWGDADEPFLWLAWCFEYSDYLKDRDGFLSHLPVALDATCSGIQIYSGLLLDREGAEAVNVVGKDRKDIYQEVANKVNGYLLSGDYEKQLSYEKSNGDLVVVDTTPIADSLKNKITRAMVKQNVMTTPYSVTQSGMVDQVTNVLKDLENSNNRFWVGETWAVARFIAKLNDRAITAVVKGAKVGQEYLRNVTRATVKDGDWVFYKAPLTNFPVLQKIHRKRVERINTPIGKLSIMSNLPSIDSLKMQNGIAPNFVHSLDAALLSMTVQKLHSDGCRDFHMIHDSFGVPVTHVANLNKRVRETFIELFETDPLTSFVSQVRPNHEVSPQEVMLNTLDLSEVADAEYIFS